MLKKARHRFPELAFDHPAVWNQKYSVYKQIHAFKKFESEKVMKSYLLERQFIEY